MKIIKQTVLKGMSQIVGNNLGTGAGGANTNIYGKRFEDFTCNEPKLIEKGFTKTSMNKNKWGYYLSKTFDDKRVIFLQQGGLKDYIKKTHNIELFRFPDEAYIIEYFDGRKIIKILEKKEQRVGGSVETKLLSGPIFREEYEEALEGQFEVEYAFCISKFLQNKVVSDDKKYTIFNKLMKKHNIPVLFGDDENYFMQLNLWIFNNSL